MFTIGPPFWAGGDVKLTQYFTSVVYPIMFEDEISLSTSEILSGYIWQTPGDDTNISTPTIVSGSLTATIVRVVYNIENEALGVTTPTIVDGSLTATIVRLVNDILPEPISISTPSIVGGSLDITVVRLEYLDWVTETTSISTPTIIGGSLT